MKDNRPDKRTNEGAEVSTAAVADAAPLPPRSTLDKLDARLQADDRAVAAPRVASFREFLLKHARVPIGGGEYGPYTFNGRECLADVVDCLDRVLGLDGGDGKPDTGPLKDATVVVAGGAQFGKTILEQNLAAYLTGCRFLNAGVYLPDDKLADSIVDAKFRPDVVDQIPWFAQMTQVGKAVNKSGKAVNTKGAFLVTDGRRKAIGMFRGLQRVPTSFSLDVVVRDEEDDIPRDKAKFLSGRLTASALRLQIIVGTQRVHGAGQNKQWEQSSQGVMMVQTRNAERGTRNEGINPEEHWPQICRAQLGAHPAPDDPQLTYDGDFKRAGETAIAHSYTPDGKYYLAHPDTGEALDRAGVVWHHRRPERLALRRFGYRISQLGIPAIDLAQIVAHWTRAVADGEEMISFCCDRLARPKSASQALTPAILERARAVAPYEFGVPASAGSPRFAGLDMGDRCWLLVNEDCEHGSRVIRADKIAAGDVVNRVRALFEAQNLTALFIDERPLVNESRTLALLLNGLEGITFPRVTDWNTAHVSLPGGLAWDGPQKKWRGLKCAVVRFTKNKLGAGIEQTVVEFEEGGQTKFIPCIAVNRFETIDRAIREFLTPAENVIEVLNGKVREHPSCLLPRRVPGSPGILETLDSHLLAGSQREKDAKTGEVGDYLDAIENHLLLARGYGALAKLVVGISGKSGLSGTFLPPSGRRAQLAASRRNQEIDG